MLETLISSKTRIKLLLRLFLNPGTTAYLRGLSEEFNESTNSIRIELNRFEEADMLVSENQGNKKIYKANNKHPLFKEINSIVLKYIGVDKIIDQVINRMGMLESVYLTGDYAKGSDSGIIDLIFVGNIDREYLVNLVTKAEKAIHRKVRYLTYTREEWIGEEEKENNLLLWSNTEV